MITQSIRRTSILVGLMALLTTVFASPAVAANDTRIPGHYIVVLKDSVKGPATVAENQTEQRDGELGLVYRHALKGYSAELSKGAVKALRKNPRVRYITPDREVEAFAQTIPSGIERIHATENASADIDGKDNRVNVDVAVIDTGLDNNHSDLNAVAWTNCVPVGEETSETIEECDDFGLTTSNKHATHVAGTIGAIDNGEGVVGVAPGARIWSVRVLNAEGSGALSWIIAGVDWVTATREDEDLENDIEVANMSLGGLGVSPALDDAISGYEEGEEHVPGSIDRGVVYVVAAGNSAANAAYTRPASNPDVITVSALADYDGKAGGLAEPLAVTEPACEHEPEEDWEHYGPDDTLAKFSNYGPDVEIAAPGVCVLSTLPEDTYGFLSGTSMASPHVAGAAALLAAEAQPESREDVEAIRQQIVEEGGLDWVDNSDDVDPEPLLNIGKPLLSAATGGTTDIDGDGQKATLRGAVNPGGSVTTYRFEYGTSTEYGQSVPASPASVGSGTKNVKVSRDVYGVEPGTTYHYRIAATSSKGTVYGADRTFVPSRWTPQDVPTTPVLGYYDLQDISCASATDCVAVGKKLILTSPLEGYRYPVVHRWDGSDWEAEAIPLPSKPGRGSGFFNSQEIKAASCTSPSFCMVLGRFDKLENGKNSGGMYTVIWNGTKWTLGPSPAGYIRDLTCASSSMCVAVGGTGQYTYIESWDGSKWTAQIPPDNEHWHVLQSVSCPTTTFCMAVGYTGGHEFDQEAETLIETWNGGSWSIQSSPNASEGEANILENVSCSSASACMAVGSTVLVEATEETWDATYGPLAARWDGSEWTAELPAHALGAVSCTASDSCMGVGVGDRETYSKMFGEPGAFAERWNGEEWEAVNPTKSGPNATLGSVSCVPGSCTAVGSYYDGVWQPFVERQEGAWTEVATEAASGIETKKATLHGTVNPGGKATTYRFEYTDAVDFADNGYANATDIPVPAKSIGAGTKDVEVSQTVSGLSPNTGYRFRVVAENEEGASYGQTRQLTTVPLAAPTAITNSVGLTGIGGALLKATVNPNGSSTTYQFEYGKTISYGSKVPASPKAIGSGASNVEAKETIEGLEPGTTYHFRVAAINSVGTAYGEDKTFTVSPIPQLTFAKEFGSEGEGNGQFLSPAGIAADPAGNVWVAEDFAMRAQRFSASGEYLMTVGSGGGGDNEEFRRGIAVDSEGNVLVARPNFGVVQRFDSDGEFIDEIGSGSGEGNGEFAGVQGIAVDPEGGIWIADANNHRIQEFDDEGEYLSQFDPDQQKGGRPLGIAVDPEGDVWVTFGSKEVREFNDEGEYLGGFDTDSGGVDAIAIDATGVIWLANGCEVQAFGAEGEQLTEFEACASGLAVDPSGNVWVVETEDQRVAKWARTFPPAATTQSAIEVGRERAILKGLVNPNGASTTYQFEYGKTTSYGSKAPASPKGIGSGSGDVEVGKLIGGLESGTTYHYRVAAVNAAGSSYGQDKTFTTPAEEAGVWVAGEESEVEADRPRFEIDNYVNWFADWDPDIEISLGSLECTYASILSPVPAATSVLPFVLSGYGCANTVGGVEYKEVSLFQNSCEGRVGLQNAGPPYTGTFGVACEEEGDQLEFRTYTDSKKTTVVCEVKVPAQEVEGIDLSNVGGALERKIELEADVEGIDYEIDGPCVEEPEILTDGTLAGELLIESFEEG